MCSRHTAGESHEGDITDVYGVMSVQGHLSVTEYRRHLSRAREVVVISEPRPHKTVRKQDSDVYWSCMDTGT